jgi:hypothetical protein
MIFISKATVQIVIGQQQIGVGEQQFHRESIRRGCLRALLEASQQFKNGRQMVVRWFQPLFAAAKQCLFQCLGEAGRAAVIQPGGPILAYLVEALQQGEVVEGFALESTLCHDRVMQLVAQAWRKLILSSKGLNRQQQNQVEDQANDRVWSENNSHDNVLLSGL